MCLNANGEVTTGAAAGTGIVGVLILTRALDAGDVVDVMTNGEITEFVNSDGSDATAGTQYSATAADGKVDATGGTPASGDRVVGFTVENTRLVVRVGEVTA